MLFRSPEYKAIQELLPEIIKVGESKTDIESYLRRLWNSCFSISEKFANAEQEIAQAIKDRDNLVLRKATLEDEIKKLDSEINNEILNSGIDRATDIISMAEVANQDIQKYSKAKGRLEVEKEIAEKEIKGIELRLKQLSKDHVDPKFLKKKELLDSLVELTLRVKEKQYKGFVKQLEEQANMHYQRINKHSGAFHGKIKFVETTTGGYLAENYDDIGQRVSNPNNSLTSSLKLAIILAIMSSNQSRGYNSRYPLISDAPVSDFDSVKAKAFLLEAVNTFSQCIIIIKDFLEPDAKRTDRFKPNEKEIMELQKEVTLCGKTLTINKLDIPDGISTTNRTELSVQIKPVEII